MYLKWLLKYLFICVEFLSLLITDVSSVVLLDGIRYLRYKGIDLRSPCLFSFGSVRSTLTCVKTCARHSACKMVSYHAVHKTCCGAESHAFDMNPVYAEDVDNSWLFIEVQDHIWYEDWVLAFRARAGTGLSVYSAWANSGHHDDAPVNTRLQLGCLSDPMSCQPIFRSVYLDTWTSAGVKKVSLRLYKKGAKVVDVVFDGTGSDAESWMTPSRILQSLWTNLPKTSGSYNYFSLEGYSSSRRRFHINAYYMGCSLDKGWLTVTDPLEGTRTPCDWEQHPPHPPYPAFIYSTASGPTTWQNNNAAVDVADVLAVFIQF